MPPTSARSQARAARRRRIRCAWCNHPFTTYHKAVKYCPASTCKIEAKAARYRLKVLARQAGGEGFTTSPAEQVMPSPGEAPVRARRRTL